jgi:hypothetical protein
MFLKLQPYSLQVQYKRGTDIPIPDALSRLYLNSYGEKLVDDDACVSVVEFSFTSDKQKQLVEATKYDPELQALITIVQSGWPEQRCDLPSEVKPYWDFRDEIVVQNGIVFRGTRVIIPMTMRSHILQLIHNGHLGIVKCKRRARDVLYWPGINSQIEEIVSKCDICQSLRRKQQKEPLIPHSVPARPWSKIACDIFEFDKVHYQIVVDYYSEYFEFDRLTDCTSATVIDKLMNHMSRFGIVDELVSDGGPCYTSEKFKAFANKWGFKHTVTSPTHSQSNGLVEKAVGICKTLFAKCQTDGTEALYLGLLANRNVPRDNIVGSPAQRFLHRRTRTDLPTCDLLLQPAILDSPVVVERLESLRQTQKDYYDLHAKELPNLYEGSQVRVLDSDNHWRPATVVKVGPEPRSYHVRTDQNRVLRRNRKYLLEDKSVRVPTVLPSIVPTVQPNVVPVNVPMSNVRPPEPNRNVVTNSGNLPRQRSAHSATQGDNLPKARSVTNTSGRRPAVSSSSTYVTRSGRAVKPNVRFKGYIT